MRELFGNWNDGDLIECFDYFAKGVIISFLASLMIIGIVSLAVIGWLL